MAEYLTDDAADDNNSPAAEGELAEGFTVSFAAVAVLALISIPPANGQMPARRGGDRRS